MEKEKLESLLIDYIDGKLSSRDRLKVEEHLAGDPASYRVYEELREVMGLMDKSSPLEPGEKLRTGFEQLLKAEMASRRPARTILFQPGFYRAAAAVALLILGAGIGFWISRENDKRPADIAQNPGAQEEQVRITREMMVMLANDQSASKRIQGVNVALTAEEAGDEIVAALVKVMNEDPNSNVRLAALGALSRFIDEPAVREQVIRSLSGQKDPVVQIALIQLLVEMKEKAVVNDLKRIVDDEETMQAVRDEAYSGILKLS